MGMHSMCSPPRRGPYPCEKRQEGRNREETDKERERGREGRGGKGGEGREGGREGRGSYLTRYFFFFMSMSMTAREEEDISRDA